LTAHEEATGQKLRAWRQFSEPKLVEIDGWTIDGAKAGPAFRALAGKVKEFVENLEASATFPMVTSIEGQEVEILSDHVKRVQTTENVTGEWYVPHVVEPAFGIDRIIWHLLDHSYTETKKEGEDYTLLSLPSEVAPIDVAVLPLSEKDGMQELAEEIHRNLCGKKGVFSVYDASGSIGRRYARADEIGVPFCITIDNQSVSDNTVTLRDRDSREQIRLNIDDLPF
jgi:glycyl-tRNA synthetase